MIRRTYRYLDGEPCGWSTAILFLLIILSGIIAGVRFLGE